MNREVSRLWGPDTQAGALGAGVWPSGVRKSSDFIESEKEHEMPYALPLHLISFPLR